MSGFGETYRRPETWGGQPIIHMLGEMAAAIGLPSDTEWESRAACAETDPEAFFPEKGGSTRRAKAVCQGCEVLPECLDDAIRTGDRHGIRGGMSENERQRLRVARMQAKRNE